MNKLCKKYIKEVKLLFPIMGKNEKIYIKRLQASVEDCMEESHSTSLQELYETFGSPKDVLTSYLASVDTDDISKLIKKKVYVKIRSYKTVTGKKMYGKYSKVKSVKVK